MIIIGEGTPTRDLDRHIATMLYLTCAFLEDTRFHSRAGGRATSQERAIVVDFVNSLYGVKSL